MANEITLKTRLLNLYEDSNGTRFTSTSDDDNIRLKKGEILFHEKMVATDKGETPVVLMKVGDGTTTNDKLNVVAARAADVYAWAKQAGLSVTVDPTSKGNVVASVSWDSDNNTLKVVKTDAVTPDELKAVTDFIGTLPTTTDAKTIVEYIDKKTEGIATSGALTELSNKVTGVETAISKLDETYATDAALNSEVTRAKAAEKANTDAIAAIKDGTTVDSFADVETALNNKVDKVAGKSLVSDTEIARLANVTNYDDTQVKADIAKNATAASNAQTAAETAQSGVNAIKADYLKTSDKTELSNAITTEANRAKAAEKVNADAIAAIEADYLTSEDKTELTGAIGTVEETAEAAKTAIEAFLKDADATADAVDTLKEIQAELDAGEASAASMLAKITALEEVDNATQAELDTAVEALNTAIGKKADSTTVNGIAGRVETLETAGYATTTQVATAKSEAISAAATDATSKADAALASAKTYADQAKADAVTTAAADATAKANKALEDAKAYADANDKDTTYTAGTGLVLNGTVFSIDPNLTLILDANKA